MSRSLYKGPFICPKLIDKIKKIKQSGTDISKVTIETKSRSCTIIPSFVGLTIAVHNGKKYIKVYVTKLMVGLKLGALSHTRVFKGHKKKQQVSGKKK